MSSAHVRAFIQLSRLKFLTGGIFGFALGAVVARADGFRITLGDYVLGQIMVSAFHLMVHYANDYFDRFCDEEAQRTAWSGGSGVLQTGLITAQIALRSALACAGVGVVAAAAFVLRGDAVAATAGIAAGILGWIYSAPPARLLARGWGELDIALLVAIAFPLVGYLTFAPAPSLRLFATALPSFAAMLVLMWGVEYPDVEVDRATGKFNLVARLGRERARVLVYGSVAAIYCTGVFALVVGAAPALPLFLLLTVPLAWALCARLAVATDAEIAGRSVALFVVTIMGSVIAYLA
ncbi:MAG: prenyltransferase [Vulcanimicrobiaceae bacterium]